MTIVLNTVIMLWMLTTEYHTLLNILNERFHERNTNGIKNLHSKSIKSTTRRINRTVKDVTIAFINFRTYFVKWRTQFIPKNIKWYILRTYWTTSEIPLKRPSTKGGHGTGQTYSSLNTPAPIICVVSYD